ncbi:MAG TPA: iron-sulfur cluster assembly scaffold protein [Candidatus Saccharimonadales bacterium]|jgi:NifU-like protein involved in Fe-S cluster formation|nr:iron-sulfur cluster assembly scaffold protein [Candidatus Saccharimonadales bacterium]
MPYSEEVLDHFEHPRNLGDIEQADARAKIEHPVCGDIMQLSVKVTGGRIDDVRFRTRGCVASIAAGSCLTEMIKGKSLAEVRAVKREQLAEALGGLPEASIHATHLAMDVLKVVLGQLKGT